MHFAQLCILAYYRLEHCEDHPAARAVRAIDRAVALEDPAEIDEKQRLFALTSISGNLPSCRAAKKSAL
jgi:hypothetical protein